MSFQEGLPEEVTPGGYSGPGDRETTSPDGEGNRSPNRPSSSPDGDRYGDRTRELPPEVTPAGLPSYWSELCLYSLGLSPYSPVISRLALL